jgi:hypothetical protein
MSRSVVIRHVCKRKAELLLCNQVGTEQLAETLTAHPVRQNNGDDKVVPLVN